MRSKEFTVEERRKCIRVTLSALKSYLRELGDDELLNINKTVFKILSK